jgi:hypothetical protein
MRKAETAFLLHSGAEQGLDGLVTLAACREWSGCQAMPGQPAQEREGRAERTVWKGLISV